jgi:hypothetical protein
MHRFRLIESGEVALSPREIFGGEVEDDDVAPWDPLGSEGEERGARTCLGICGGSWASSAAGPKGVPGPFCLLFCLLFIFYFLISFITFSNQLQIQSNQILKISKNKHNILRQ